MPLRSVSTGYWSDLRTTALSPQAQLVHLRLITGDDTDAAGATQVRPKRLAVDTNLDPAEVERALEELIEAGLVRQYDDWLWIPSWIKHQVKGLGIRQAAQRAAGGHADALRMAISRELAKNPPRTGKTATTRDYPEPLASLDSASGEPPMSLPGGPGGRYQEQGQDQGQGQTQSGVVEGSGEEEGRGTNPAGELDRLEAISSPSVAAAIRRGRVAGQGSEGDPEPFPAALSSAAQDDARARDRAAL